MDSNSRSRTWSIRFLVLSLLIASCAYLDTIKVSSLTCIILPSHISSRTASTFSTPQAYTSYPKPPSPPRQATPRAWSSTSSRTWRKHTQPPKSASTAHQTSGCSTTQGARWARCTSSTRASRSTSSSSGRRWELRATRGCIPLMITLISSLGSSGRSRLGVWRWRGTLRVVCITCRGARRSSIRCMRGALRWNMLEVSLACGFFNVFSFLRVLRLDTAYVAVWVRGYFDVDVGYSYSVPHVKNHWTRDDWKSTHWEILILTKMLAWIYHILMISIYIYLLGSWLTVENHFLSSGDVDSMSTYVD